MSDKKIKLVYDATIIANGITKNSSRSGIFFTALNILKEFYENDNIDLYLFCDMGKVKDLEQVLKSEIRNQKFKFALPFESIIYFKLKMKKCKLKKEGKKFQKTLLQLIIIPFSIFNRLLKIIYLPLNVFYFKKFDAFLSPIIKIPKYIHCKKYNILYDLIPLVLPEYHEDTFEKGNWLYDLCESLNSKDCYFAISDATKNDFLKYYPKINPNNIKTTLLACDKKFKPINIDIITKIKQKYNIPQDKKYVFSLCTLEPRKNLIRAVKTFIQFIQKNNIDNMYFVLGGGHWDSFINKIEQEIENLGDYKNKIIKAGYVDDEDLPALYSGAEWFVYTSMYEGFGLPPLEAMSCGCPVITSNNSSIPEVVGDAGIMIDWDSDEQHIQAYEQYYFNKELRLANRQKGLDRAKQFSWKKCAGQIVKVISKN